MGAAAAGARAQLAERCERSAESHVLRFGDAVVYTYKRLQPNVQGPTRRENHRTCGSAGNGGDGSISAARR